MLGSEKFLTQYITSKRQENLLFELPLSLSFIDRNSTQPVQGWVEVIPELEESRNSQQKEWEYERSSQYPPNTSLRYKKTTFANYTGTTEVYA